MATSPERGQGSARGDGDNSESHTEGRDEDWAKRQIGKIRAQGSARGNWNNGGGHMEGGELAE
jgi:hypothetical protein